MKTLFYSNINNEYNKKLPKICRIETKIIKCLSCYLLDNNDINSLNVFNPFTLNLFDQLFLFNKLGSFLINPFI